MQWEGKYAEGAEGVGKTLQHTHTPWRPDPELGAHISCHSSLSIKAFEDVVQHQLDILSRFWPPPTWTARRSACEHPGALAPRFHLHYPGGVRLIDYLLLLVVGSRVSFLVALLELCLFHQDSRRCVCCKSHFHLDPPSMCTRSPLYLWSPLPPSSHDSGAAARIVLFCT